MSELRFHPFLGQWVITATHRQDRTFLPPDDFCPLCPTRPRAEPTEIPFDTYDIVVFENRFPSLATPAPEPSVEGGPLTPVLPSSGVCEVVCYSEDHFATFATLPRVQVRKLTRVWRERYLELAAREEVDYVFIFENKGKEIGVTLTHPHGQIYAYPFIPPVPARELERERQHQHDTGHTLFESWLATELGGPRVVDANDLFVSVVPFFARFPYELWVVPTEPIRHLGELDARGLDLLADALHRVSQAYDRLFGFSLPYIMAMHQEPATPGYGFTRLHVEFTPPHREANKLKYLAGSEAGAGAFINDTLPEASAERLRACFD